ncbi:hypothetical protein LTR36_010273 [Oleoguttula mirabilis]|uniref:Stress-activated map kinase-interacting protein n=1 Tax=Oleoguttula mirabilis TaxID=1507867 RepID=A0AAV9J4K3_9PEZI|nr:hypothetical protein LTR36_010273 [Oleoguttula mirabilis]
MSLLLNEEFTLYRLRASYLNNSHDGVGERLIHLNTAVLNEPAFRAAGWVADAAAIKRCYSPPIPTTGAAEYFNRPVRTRAEGVSLADSPAETYGGLISGQRGSEDTLGPSALTEKERRRRKQGQKMDEDDSSDLSDDSDEEETAMQSVKFAKMPTRKRSSLSPVRDAALKAAEGPEVTVISPSYRPRTSSLRATESLNAAVVNARTGRPRRDTTTSSEMSSENEGLGPETAFRRKMPSRPPKSALLSEQIAEEGPDDESELEDEDVEVAEASDLSDEFEGDDVTPASPVLPFVGEADASEERKPRPSIPPAISATQSSPKKSGRDNLPKLPKLPPGRPMSMLPPSSLLSMALKGNGSGDASADKPFQKFAGLSGKGEAQPLWIKIYAPFSEEPEEPLQVPLRRAKDAEGGVPTVNELIGLALWRYDEEGYEPALTGKDAKIENWELRMVEDGEVDMDFPALSKARVVTDFTSNNNRPPQRRMRDKPWDEFGLVRAESAAADSDDEAAPAPVQTDAARPKPVPTPSSISVQTASSEAAGQPPATPGMVPTRNPITGPSFRLNVAMRKDSTNLLDAPQTQTATSTPRMGAAKTLAVHFTDPQSFQTKRITIPTTADTYIAELFDTACARLGLDKALYVFKVRGTQTVAPSDRTVEALGSNLHLDIVRRRFGAVGDFGLGLSGSPGSSSPNAPLELVPNTPPTAKEAKRRKGFGGVTGVLHPLTVQQRNEWSSTSSAFDLNAGVAAGVGGGAGQMDQVGRRYNVLRKLPLSFSASHPRTLVITPEYMQILPGPPIDDPTGVPPTQGKVTNVPMSSIVGVKVSRKHAKMMRVLVYREKETKRYDFECGSRQEAESIVGDIRVGLAEYGVGGDD